MFEAKSIQEYKYRQSNKNLNRKETYLKEHIYVFFLRSEYNRSKYVVTIKEYANGLLTIDFYRKVSTSNKFRILSNEFKFGHLGATILDIMRDIQERSKVNTFGILASNLLSEDKNENNKRFRVYVEVLRRKIDADKYQVLGSDTFSTIFVIPLGRKKEEKEIVISYGNIFKETR